MIELKFTGPCERCTHRDLFLEKSDLYQDGKIYATSCEVHCNHEDICKVWANKLRNSEEQGASAIDAAFNSGYKMGKECG